MMIKMLIPFNRSYVTQQTNLSKQNMDANISVKDVKAMSTKRKIRTLPALRENQIKNIDKSFQSVAISRKATMPMVCVKTVIILKEGQRWHLCAIMLIGCSMQKVCAKTATLAYTIRKRDRPE